MEAILWILFVLACVLVSTVILLQEGKGGGLSEAFGGVGQQTFGVKAEGINKFTGWVSFIVVVLAIVITRVRSGGTALSFSPPPGQQAPADTGAAPADAGAPAAPAGEQPAPAAPAGEQPAPAPQTPPDGAPK
ncbi:MAG TPA: preprotein translocase subunit SecG [Planctomycetota bacterium]|nr:preprotein translocase subunit SecG [Planctomycetota bacterium]